MKVDVKTHYDLLIEENNDPVYDNVKLKTYMNKFDGECFKHALLPLEEKTVLEIGVGTGRLAKIYAPQCCEFTGIDISQKTIERAKENLKEIDCSLICADFLNYKFSQKFDVIYSSLTFMHIKDKKKAINKIYSLLNDKGKFVLSITKNQDKILDYGTRQVEIYQNNLSDIKNYIENASLSVLNVFETELAFIIESIKGNK